MYTSVRLATINVHTMYFWKTQQHEGQQQKTIQMILHTNFQKMILHNIIQLILHTIIQMILQTIILMILQNIL